MTKNEIKTKIKTNYCKQVQEYISEMKKAGYVLGRDENTVTPSDVFLMKMDLNELRFKIVSRLSHAHSEINFNRIRNPFKIVLNNDELINMFFNVFQIVNIKELDAFSRFAENKELQTSAKELDVDLKKFLKVSAEIGNSADTEMCTPQTQALALAQMNVFYTGREKGLRISETNKYYQWNNKDKEFKKLTAQDLQELLCTYFNKSKNELKVLDIEKHMRHVYPLMLINTAFCVEYNKQKKIQKQLKQDKKAYDKIMKIVANFE